MFNKMFSAFENVRFYRKDLCELYGMTVSLTKPSVSHGDRCKQDVEKIINFKLLC